jgi:hypothetical protein
MDAEYQRLRALVAAPRSSRAFRIGEISPPQAAEAFDRLALAGESALQIEGRLLESSRDLGDAGALLCLRCRVSQALHQKLRVLHRQFGQRHQLDLMDMAATVLDDQGQLLPWQPPAEAKDAEPFTLAVVRGFQPSRGGNLATWSRVMLQSHPELVQLLRWHGLLLIRDWALLAHSSPTRMERAWHLHGRLALPIQRVRSLHQLFRQEYADAADTDSGHWQPDAIFLKKLDPGTPHATLMAALQAMAKALRHERLQTLPNLPAVEASAAEPEPREWLALQQRLNTCLHQALLRQLPAMLGAGKAEESLRRCLWQGFAEGLSQRTIAERCGLGGKGSQSTVSRKLQIQAHVSAIVTSAARELRGHRGFEELGHSTADSERIVAALARYLMEPLPPDARPRLAHWLQPLLPPSDCPP